MGRVLGMLSRRIPDSVVIAKLDLVRIAVLDPETNPPLVVDRNGMARDGRSWDPNIPIEQLKLLHGC